MTNRLDRAKVIFLHIGWAKNYQGAADDPVQGKFGYFKSGKKKGEELNFKAFGRYCYGYAAQWTISPLRLGETKGDDYVDDVLVIWTATDPDGSGRFIVGWYKNARVYASMRDLRPDKGRPDIITRAAVGDCHVVSEDDRTFFIPAMERGWPGISQAWYARERLSETQMNDLLAYVGGTPSNGFIQKNRSSSTKLGLGRSSDPDQRFRVEKAAEDFVEAHYKARCWEVERVGEKKRGWDMELTRGARFLRIEVKGRSESGAIELTPNEYASMKKREYRMSYRIAVVFFALSNSPKLTIFSYSPGARKWLSKKGIVLNLKEKPGAIATF